MVTIKSNGAAVTVNQMEPPRFALGEMQLPQESPAALGDDFNIPLLVQEAGGRQLARLHVRRSQLETELVKLNTQIEKLEELVAIASSSIY